MDPERVCQICKRIIENINKEYRHDLKNQKDDYSHEENINDKVKKAEETHELFKSKNCLSPKATSSLMKSITVKIVNIAQMSQTGT